MMTRKDYVKVAAMFAACHDDQDATSVRDYLLYGMADMFQADNSRFDRGRFVRAATDTGKRS